MNKQQGFTLVEILIALFVFAIMSTIATVGLTSVIRSYERSSIHFERLAELQIAMTIMQQDMTQMINRPILDNVSERQPAFSATRPEYFEFTRVGYSNPQMTLPRSTLQRVAYQWQDNQLIRTTWPVLDRATNTAPMQRILLTDVTQMQIRFLSDKNQFFTSWPTPQAASVFPKAIEITLNLKDYGSIQRLFLIPATGPGQS